MWQPLKRWLVAFTHPKENFKKWQAPWAECFKAGILSSNNFWRSCQYNFLQQRSESHVSHYSPLYISVPSPPFKPSHSVLSSPSHWSAPLCCSALHITFPLFVTVLLHIRVPILMQASPSQSYHRQGRGIYQPGVCSPWRCCRSGRRLPNLLLTSGWLPVYLKRLPLCPDLQHPRPCPADDSGDLGEHTQLPSYELLLGPGLNRGPPNPCLFNQLYRSRFRFGMAFKTGEKNCSALSKVWEDPMQRHSEEFWGRDKGVRTPQSIPAHSSCH